MLVLHDPSTAVDAATEARIARGLRAVRDGRTTLVVTTSPALLAVTDRVAAIDERGVVVGGDARRRSWPATSATARTVLA